MRLQTEETLHHPGLKDLSEMLKSLLMRPDKKGDLIFDNGDYIRIQWDKSRGLFLLFFKDGKLTFVNRKFAPSFHDVEIILYRSVRGEKPKEGEIWKSISPYSLFSNAPYMSILARLMIYLSFGLIIGMMLYELFINPLKINYREVSSIMSAAIGLSLIVELYPFYRYHDYLSGSFFKDNVHWGFWLCVILAGIGFLGLWL